MRCFYCGKPRVTLKEMEVLSVLDTVKDYKNLYEIADIIGMSQASLSYHLRNMIRKGIIKRSDTKSNKFDVTHKNLYIKSDGNDNYVQEEEKKTE